MNNEQTAQIVEPAAEHFHRTPDGVLLQCYHKCKTLFTQWEFWAGMTIGFPIEHFLWEKVWPFYLVTEWMGL